MTPEYLKKIRELCEAATKGPWQRSYFVDFPQYANRSKEWKKNADVVERHMIRGPGIVGQPSCNVVMQIECREDQDRDFVAESRTALPALLDYVDRLEKIVGVVENALKIIERAYPIDGDRMAHQDYALRALSELAEIREGKEC